MTQRPLTRVQLQEAVDAFESTKTSKCPLGNQVEAACSLDLPKSTFTHRLRMALKEGVTPNAEGKEYETPDLPSDEIPPEELKERLKKRFIERQKAHQARSWMKFKVKVEGPFALAFIGDPHLDDNGCNWPLLDRDIELVKNTEALWSVGLGDYTNNWAGILSQRVSPMQEVTRPQAWRLAEWFFGQKKPNGQSIHWLLIKGNHDVWSNEKGLGDPLDWMEHGAGPLEDWKAQFVAVCSNGREVPIYAAHNFKGHSFWHPGHGPLRKARLQGEAELYICGDKHTWQCIELEDPERPGRVFWAVRARGYKFMDDYAVKLGHEQQQYGCTITAVIDPEASGPCAIRCFPDLEEAADFLKFKRKGLR